jgi:hydroxymethylpyrimidine/phosphomethylpyrimidine kinase
LRENFIALTIAGSDPGGGAGIQADLKTFHQLRVCGTSVVTLVTVQNTVRMSRVETLDAGLVGEQLDAVLEDLPPLAIKTGALGTRAIVEAVAARKFACPLVVDPVAMGKHGMALMDAEAQLAIRRVLLPRAALVTPNLDEAEALAGIAVRDAGGMREAARRISEFGVKAVLVKGGHLSGNDDALDILWDGSAFTEFSRPRVVTRHTHGTGCVYSAAIAAGLARGFALVEAVGRAKHFVDAAIRNAPGIGAGAGPLDLWAEPDPHEPNSSGVNTGFRKSGNVTNTG